MANLSPNEICAQNHRILSIFGANSTFSNRQAKRWLLGSARTTGSHRPFIKNGDFKICHKHHKVKKNGGGGGAGIKPQHKIFYVHSNNIFKLECKKWPDSRCTRSSERKNVSLNSSYTI